MDLVIGREYRNITFEEKVIITMIRMEKISSRFVVAGENEHEVIHYKMVFPAFRNGSVDKTTSFMFRQKFIDVETERDEKLTQLGL